VSGQIPWADRHTSGEESRYVLKMIRYKIGERDTRPGPASCNLTDYERVPELEAVADRPIAAIRDTGVRNTD
jgi:hypothetical protein